MSFLTSLLICSLLKTAYENTKSSGYNTFLETQSKSLTKLSITLELKPQLFNSLKRQYIQFVFR